MYLGTAGLNKGVANWQVKRRYCWSKYRACAVTRAHCSTNPARADDLVQDTLERAWGRLNLWRSGSDIRAWLFTIMHNVFVNQVRRKHIVETPVEPDNPEHDPADVGSADQTVALRDLNAALQQLPEEYREVLLLVGLEQMRYEEAATVLGIPLGTVMSRLSRGRERLRAHIGSGTQAALRRVK